VGFFSYTTIKVFKPRGEFGQKLYPFLSGLLKNKTTDAKSAVLFLFVNFSILCFIVDDLNQNSRRIGKWNGSFDADAFCLFVLFNFYQKTLDGYLQK